MKPTPFKEQNTVFAKDQPQYKQLPVHVKKTPTGEVVSVWKLSFRERIILLFTGRVYQVQCMFGKPLTPSYLTTKKKEVL